MLIFYAQARLRLYKFISIAASDHWVVRTIECHINGSRLYSEQISFHLAFGQIFFKAVSSNFTCSKVFLGNSNYAYDHSVFHLHILIAKKHFGWFILRYDCSELFLCSIWLQNQHNFGAISSLLFCLQTRYRFKKYFLVCWAISVISK